MQPRGFESEGCIYFTIRVADQTPLSAGTMFISVYNRPRQSKALARLSGKGDRLRWKRGARDKLVFGIPLSSPFGRHFPRNGLPVTGKVFYRDKVRNSDKRRPLMRKWAWRGKSITTFWNCPS